MIQMFRISGTVLVLVIVVVVVISWRFRFRLRFASSWWFGFRCVFRFWHGYVGLRISSDAAIIGVGTGWWRSWWRRGITRRVLFGMRHWFGLGWLK